MRKQLILTIGLLTLLAVGCKTTPSMKSENSGTDMLMSNGKVPMAMEGTKVGTDSEKSSINAGR